MIPDRQLMKTSNRRTSQLIQYWSQTLFKFSTNMIFKEFLCVPQMILGLHSKDRKSTLDKANISNPKVDRVCPPLTAKRTSADCVQISLGPSIKYIQLRVYYTGGFNAIPIWTARYCLDLKNDINTLNIPPKIHNIIRCLTPRVDFTYLD